MKGAKNLSQDIEDDPLIKDQMVNLGCFLVYTLGDYLTLSGSTYNKQLRPWRLKRS